MSEHASNDEIARDITIAWLGQPSSSHFVTDKQAAEAYKLFLKAVQNPYESEGND
ncbi:hypothetical protein [Sporolactobacillus nakayamae]|uniref:Uncharacterized protein n=1 Tax=Sporolactobacillus nakayamae TaxID=269670 RepID=A0A1I2P3N9_9BACL|nr:hypothetical protein [Sporolactobacillus nakayamae]SFG09689.1 hypothetical protein SAMN02982927_00658 [Sporolactobacillus nakayamae]